MTRYNKGVIFYTHKGKTTTSTVGSRSFDAYIRGLSSGTYDLGRIPAGYDQRPDLISNLFFGDSDSWWKLMIANNIWDPFEGLKVGNQILLPRK